MKAVKVHFYCWTCPRSPSVPLRLVPLRPSLQATKSILEHISRLLAGEEAAQSPCPPALPRTWLLVSSSILGLLRPPPITGCGQHASASAPPAPKPAPDAAGPSRAQGLGAPDGDTHMPDAPGVGQPSASAAERAMALLPAWQQQQQQHAKGPSSSGSDGGGGMPPQQPGADAASSEDPGAASSPPAQAAAAPAADVSAAPALEGAALLAPEPLCSALPPDPAARSVLDLLADVMQLLCGTVTRAHALGRTVLLLRGEAAAKHPSPTAYMPACLSANEVVAQVDAMWWLAAALQAQHTLKAGLTGLLAADAMRDMLGVGGGKVYIATVIMSGLLSRDLGIDSVVPQALRQGFITAVLPALETGALLTERRAPQVYCSPLELLLRWWLLPWGLCVCVCAPTSPPRRH